MNSSAVSEVGFSEYGARASKVGSISIDGSDCAADEARVSLSHEN